MVFQSQKYESFIKCMTNIRVSCRSVTRNDLNLCSRGSRILSELHKSFTYVYCYSAHIWYTSWPKAMCTTKQNTFQSHFPSKEAFKNSQESLFTGDQVNFVQQRVIQRHFSIYIGFNADRIFELSKFVIAHNEMNALCSF